MKHVSTAILLMAALNVRGTSLLKISNAQLVLQVLGYWLSIRPTLARNALKIVLVALLLKSTMRQWPLALSVLLPSSSSKTTASRRPMSQIQFPSLAVPEIPAKTALGTFNPHLQLPTTPAQSIFPPAVTLPRSILLSLRTYSLLCSPFLRCTTGRLFSSTSSR